MPRTRTPSGDRPTAPRRLLRHRLEARRAVAIIALAALSTGVAAAPRPAAGRAATGPIAARAQSTAPPAPAATASPSAQPVPTTSARPASTPPRKPGRTSPSAPASVAAPSARRHLDWGVYVPGFPGSTAAIDAAEQVAGRHVDIVMWYVHWGGPWSAYSPADVQAVVRRGSVPMITWMSDDPSAPGYPDPSAQRAYGDRAIAAGQFDAYILGWARGLRAIGGPVLLSFDHEMNGNWSLWSPGVNGQTAQDYVAAWRHVHDIFRAAGATNVRWVWSPNVGYPGSSPLGPLYPGDDVVDRVGIDGYNWGTTDANHTWQSYGGIFDATAAQVAAITHRPMMLGEVASTEVGGDKAAWITDFFATLAHRPSISAFVWFDADKETDWRINSSAASSAAFAAGLSRVG